MNTARFLKYVWPFFDIMHENANEEIRPDLHVTISIPKLRYSGQGIVLGYTDLMDEFIGVAKTDRKDKFQEANKPVNQVKNRY